MAEDMTILVFFTYYPASGAGHGGVGNPQGCILLSALLKSLLC